METRDKVRLSLEKHGGNVSAVSRELGINRSTVVYHRAKLGMDKPLAAGQVRTMDEQVFDLPKKGKVKRYLLTSAQNNTRLHGSLWDNLLAFANHVEAEILVSTYTYNKNAYGKLAVKRGTAQHDENLWYDERIEDFVCDQRTVLAPGLVFCGEMNILPTAENPLEGFETYTGRRSGIFPHAKFAMRSIATMKGEGTKFNYTTGTCTQRNYIQKKAGLKAEHRHSYGALLVEIDSDGHWWVRQLNADDRGSFQDLDVRVEGGKCLSGQQVEAITWGDVHVAQLEPTVRSLAWGEQGMLDTLRPRFQFIHDLLDGVSFTHHDRGNPHVKFKKFLAGQDDVVAELREASAFLKEAERPWCQTVVVDSNHDGWLMRWLREHDYRTDPRNAVFFLESQLAVYRALESRERGFCLVEHVMRKLDCPRGTKFLRTDESFKTCKGSIENGMHGHLGPDGARGNAQAFSRMGRKANTAHSHSASIHDGLYVAGASCSLDQDYNAGPSSWSHSHIVTYPSGKRAIVTVWAGKWRA